MARIRSAEVVTEPHVRHPFCEWPGCRDDKMNHVSAVALATYEIITGRTHANQWQGRMMGLCGAHVEEFKKKYASNSVQ